MEKKEQNQAKEAALSTGGCPAAAQDTDGVSDSGTKQRTLTTCPSEGAVVNTYKAFSRKLGRHGEVWASK